MDAVTRAVAGRDARGQRDPAWPHERPSVPRGHQDSGCTPALRWVLGPASGTWDRGRVAKVAGGVVKLSRQGRWRYGRASPAVVTRSRPQVRILPIPQRSGPFAGQGGRSKARRPAPLPQRRKWQWSRFNSGRGEGSPGGSSPRPETVGIRPGNGSQKGRRRFDSHRSSHHIKTDPKGDHAQGE